MGALHGLLSFGRRRRLDFCLLSRGSRSRHADRRCHRSVGAAALDRAHDLVRDVLVNIEAFGFHGGHPLLAGRAIAALWGSGGPGPASRGIKRRASGRAASRGGATQANFRGRAEASRVERAAGPVTRPTREAARRPVLARGPSKNRGGKSTKPRNGSARPHCVSDQPRSSRRWSGLVGSDTAPPPCW